MTETASTAPTAIRVVAEYQLMSEAEGKTWMTDTLQDAVDAGTLLDYTVTGSHQGRFGLQLVTFTVDVPYAYFGNVDYDVAKDAAGNLLNEIVHDTDVEVRWVLAVFPTPWVITDPEGDILARFTTEQERDQALLDGTYPDDAEPAYVNDPSTED